MWKRVTRVHRNGYKSSPPVSYQRASVNIINLKTYNLTDHFGIQTSALISSLPKVLDDNAVSYWRNWRESFGCKTNLRVLGKY